MRQRRILGEDALRVYRDVRVDDPDDLQQPQWLIDGVDEYTGVLEDAKIRLRFDCD